MAAFSAREVRKAQKRKERNAYLQKDSESQSKRQSHANELSETCRKRVVGWDERSEKERQ